MEMHHAASRAAIYLSMMYELILQFPHTPAIRFGNKYLKIKINLLHQALATMTTPINPSLIAAFKKLRQAIDLLESKAVESAIRQRAAESAESARLAAGATDTQKRFATLESELQGLHEEAGHLKNENAELSRKLHRLQQDYLELQQMAGAAVTRLDGSIRQLDMMLEH